jgi:exosortase
MVGKGGWSVSKTEALTWAVFAALLILNYLATLKWMVARWDEAESYMAHGWLIPPISLWLLWLERDKLARAPRSGTAAGFYFIAVSLVLHVIAGLADVSSISGLTLVGVVFGFALLRFGWPVARIAWFPIVFLAFMIPPPEFVISKMNFTLKLTAADFATGLLNLTGFPAIRQGSFMVFGSEKLAVGDVCSGLRSLLALLSLSVLYAWLIRERGKAHVLAVLLMAVPAAIVGNGVRIFLVSCLVMALGQEAVFKPRIGTWDLHLFTGAFIFIAAFGCLYLATFVIDKIQAARSPRVPA